MRLLLPVLALLLAVDASASVAASDETRADGGRQVAPATGQAPRPATNPAEDRVKSETREDRRWIPLYEQLREGRRDLRVGSVTLTSPLRLESAVRDGMVELKLIDAGGTPYQLEIDHTDRDEHGIPKGLIRARHGNQVNPVNIPDDAPPLLALIQIWRDENGAAERTRRIKLRETPGPSASTLQLADWVGQLLLRRMPVPD